MRFLDTKFAFVFSLLFASCAIQPQVEWVSISIDGKRRSEFKLITRGNGIIGGHDGYNAWSDSNHDGMITIDLEGCAPDPVNNAYWAIVTGEDVTLSQQGSRLTVRNRGREGVFITVR